MSDPKMMSVTEARAWLDPSTGPKPEVPSPLLVDRYARTIVHQAEQIERLQAALCEADRNWHDALSSEYEYTCEPEGFVSTYEALIPGDMGPQA